MEGYFKNLYYRLLDEAMLFQLLLKWKRFAVLRQKPTQILP